MVKWITLREIQPIIFAVMTEGNHENQMLGGTGIWTWNLRNTSPVSTNVPHGKLLFTNNARNDNFTSVYWEIVSFFSHLLSKNHKKSVAVAWSVESWLPTPARWLWFDSRLVRNFNFYSRIRCVPWCVFCPMLSLALCWPRFQRGLLLRMCLASGP